MNLPSHLYIYTYTTLIQPTHVEHIVFVPFVIYYIDWLFYLLELIFLFAFDFQSMVAGLLDAITKVRQIRFHNDDDFIDRLSRRYSVVLLMIFTVIVSTKQYVGDRKFSISMFPQNYPHLIVSCNLISTNYDHVFMIKFMKRLV